MKTHSLLLIGRRALVLCFGLALICTGCGDSGGPSGGTPSDEEIKRDISTRKAMEEASKAASKTVKKH